jgi:hypothetical protein
MDCRREAEQKSAKKVGRHRAWSGGKKEQTMEHYWQKTKSQDNKQRRSFDRSKTRNLNKSICKLNFLHKHAESCMRQGERNAFATIAVLRDLAHLRAIRT